MRALPPPDRAACFLDFDGTLVEIAPTPDAVRVPGTLPATLHRLAFRLEGALALVSGRPIAELDRLLGPPPLPAAGQHGAERRAAAAAPIAEAGFDVPPPEWIVRARALAAAHPGAILEQKRHGFALHYRATPPSGPIFERELRPMVETNPDFVLMGGKAVWEIRPKAAHKGAAVTAFMASPPFAGRTPIYVGDDVTDEDGIEAAERLGGIGLRVPADFGTPGAVRAWLADFAA